MARARRRGAAPLALLAVIVALLVAADVTAKRLAQQELGDRLRQEVPEAGGSSASIHSFPFLVRLLTTGEVARVDAAVTDVAVEGLRFASIAVRLHGVELDRDQLLGDRHVVLERIDRGEVRAEVTQEAISELAGVTVTIDEGRASIRVAGRRLSADLAVRDGRLVVGAAGVSLPAIELPSAPLLPCVAGAELVPGRVVLTCELSEVPRELLTEAQAHL